MPSTPTLSARLEQNVVPPSTTAFPRLKNEPLRLLHLLSQQPGKTGSGVYLEAIVQQAAAHGAQQQVVVGVPTASNPRIAPLNAEDIWKVQFETPALPFPVAGMSDVMPYANTRFSSFTPEMREAYLAAFAQVITAAVEQFRPHLMHSHHLWLMTALARSLYPHIPLVTSCHGTELRQLVLASELAPYVRPACSRIDAVLALHEHQLAELQTAYTLPANRLHLIGAGYRDDLFCLNQTQAKEHSTSSQTIRLLYAGKISRPKGVPWLLEALSHIDIPPQFDICLELAGASGSGLPADAFPVEVPARVQLRYLGALDQESLAKRMQAADIFILPSFFEGLPLVLLESLACGCLLVVTDLPGLETWLPANLSATGIIEKVPLPPLMAVDQPHPKALPLFVRQLAAAISRQLQRIADQTAIPPAKVVDCVNRLSWKHIYLKIEKIYHDVLQRN